ncbi:MAG: alpha-hydroxy-acid oxidizing protein [Betaproteobacteria bacterium]|nr:alpha-hydroxy-acid oxidizing protein [Betaproteobacteria bacterium]
MPDISQYYNIEDLRRGAEQRLPRAIFDFFDGGSEDEITLRDNRAAFHRWCLLPKVLQDVSAIDSTCEIVGRPAKYPLVIAPTGGIGMGRPGADLAIARTAANLGIPYTLSTNATASIEAIAQQASGRLWFQLYVLQDRGFMEKLIARAEAAGFEALIPTVDLAVGGKRERDFRNGFSTRFKPQLRHYLKGMRKPAWALSILANGGLPDFINIRGYRGSEQTGETLASSVARDTDPAFNWDDLARMRDRWKRKLIIKGVSRVDDAMRLVALGVDGIWVSNHGGRQLDGAIASFDAMTAIAAAVGNKVSVIMDGGIRRGADLFMIRALGGEAGAIGRAGLYGVAAGGEQGARRALDILTDELIRAMQLCGTPRIADITPDLVGRRPA